MSPSCSSRLQSELNRIKRHTGRNLDRPDHKVANGVAAKGSKERERERNGDDGGNREIFIGLQQKRRGGPPLGVLAPPCLLPALWPSYVCDTTSNAARSLFICAAPSFGKKERRNGVSERFDQAGSFWIWNSRSFSPGYPDGGGARAKHSQLSSTQTLLFLCNGICAPIQSTNKLIHTHYHIF